MAIEQFERLETGISVLLTQFEDLKSENIQLRETAGAKDAEIDSLKDKLARLEKEKNQVKEKVDVLLVKLDSLIQSA